MSDRRLVLAVIAALAATACSSGPSSTSIPTAGTTATPGATALPTTQPTSTPPASPTAAPPTGTPLPEPTAADIAAWASDICAVNATFLTDNQQITTDIPEPTERTLEALKLINADRQLRVEQAYADAVAGLNALTPYPGGEPFRMALLAEMQSALNAMPAFFQTIAAATSVAEIDAQYAMRGTVQSDGLLESAQSVVAMDAAFSDAVAGISTGCRFFEFDARARVHGIETAEFSDLVIDETFDAHGKWQTGPFDGGTATIADGALTLAFDSAATYVEDTSDQRKADFHDVRIESHFTQDGSSLTGLSCRGSRLERYSVYINVLGLVLIYRISGDEITLLGRRVAPDGFDSSAGVDLAIECLAGNSDPFSLIVYVSGERIAEVQEEQALQSEGAAGMTAQALAAASATFDEFRVLIPAE